MVTETNHDKLDDKLRTHITACRFGFNKAVKGLAAMEKHLLALEKALLNCHAEKDTVWDDTHTDNEAKNG